MAQTEKKRRESENARKQAARRRATADSASPGSPDIPAAGAPGPLRRVTRAENIVCLDFEGAFFVFFEVCTVLKYTLEVTGYFWALVYTSYFSGTR
jgi:hypothetical protein